MAPDLDCRLPIAPPGRHPPFQPLPTTHPRSLAYYALVQAGGSIGVGEEHQSVRNVIQTTDGHQSEPVDESRLRSYGTVVTRS